MEQNEEGLENTIQEFLKEDEIGLTRIGIKYIKESANWAQFLSILGFIVIGFMLLGSIFAGTMFSQFDEFGVLPFPSFLFGLIYLIVAIIYFFPIYYLYKFSSEVKRAINLKNSMALESGLKNLKSHYKFLGIATIVVLAIYILAFIIIFFASSLINGL